MGLALAAALAFAPAPAAGQVARLHPADDAAQEPELFALRAQMLRALARRDLESLLRGIAPDVRNSFGDDQGLASFRARWKLDRADSPLWDELSSVLSLGGRFEGPDTFIAPYVFTDFPSDVDALQHVAVIGTSVRVRGAPDLNAPVVEMLSFDVVHEDRPEGAQFGVRDGTWAAVTLADGRTGYISSRFVRGPLDYRAIFERRNGRWLLTAFLAGD